MPAAASAIEMAINDERDRDRVEPAPRERRAADDHQRIPTAPAGCRFSSQTSATIHAVNAAAIAMSILFMVQTVSRGAARSINPEVDPRSTRAPTTQLAEAPTVGRVSHRRRRLS